VAAEIFTNFWCFVHNFGYRYARKSFKGSKDGDFGLVSEKILSHIIMAQWVGAQGQVNVAKNTPTPLVAFPPENPPPKTKIFFLVLTTRLAESVEGLNSSLAQSPDRL